MSTQRVTPGRGRLPVPMRDRRPALAALALLLVVAGALGSALIAYRSGNRSDVLMARADIPAGHKMTASDFGVTRIASDSSNVVPASAEPSFIGSFAAFSVPAGTLVNSRMFTNQSVIPSGAETVGLSLDSTHRPVKALRPGDVVRIYFIPSKSDPGVGANVGAGPAQVLVQAARVIDVGAASTTSSSAASGISVLLSATDAQNVVPAATGNEVAVSLLPLDAKPTIDLVRN